MEFIERAKEMLKKAWNFIWNDDSIWGWLASLALAFILVKFVFFPVLSLALATKMPLVVVESGSMHHPGSFIGDTFGFKSDFGEWWDSQSRWYENKNITKEQALKWPLRTGLEIGDIVVLYGRAGIKQGDIIIFNAGQKHPIIHRVVEIKEKNNETYYSTKGDNNSEQLAIEKEISRDALVGKAIFKIPKLGWLKLAFVKLFQLIF